MSALLLCLSLILQSGFASTHVFNSPFFNTGSSTATTPLPDVNCAPGADCMVTCIGQYSCRTIYHPIPFINGPSGKALTINVDGELAFNVKINCLTCSSLTINVVGSGGSVGGAQFTSQTIIGSATGNNKLDCRGPVNANGNNGAATKTCHTMNFHVPNGFGTQGGQVYVVDASNYVNRVDLTWISVFCSNPATGSIISPFDYCTGYDVATQGIVWNHHAGHANCDKITLGCQNPLVATDNPTSSPITPAPVFPVQNNAPIAKVRTIQFSKKAATPPGYVLVSIYDFYFMRLCNIIVLIGFCIIIIKSIMGFINHCNWKNYAYSKVLKYDIDSTDSQT